MLLTMPASSHNFFGNRHISFYSENNLYENTINFDTEFLIPCCSKYIDINETNTYPTSSQSLPTSFFEKFSNTNYQVNSRKKDESIKEITQTSLFKKSHTNISNHVNISYSSEVKVIANELLFLCDQFDKELYHDIQFIEGINKNCNNFLSLFVTSIMYCISDVLK